MMTMMPAHCKMRFTPTHNLLHQSWCCGPEGWELPLGGCFSQHPVSVALCVADSCWKALDWVQVQGTVSHRVVMTN
jgi:hypothetical protein